MRVLVICPHYAPDTAPTGEVMTRIAGELAQRGHELHVVTSLPWYLHHRVEPGWTGRLVRREDRGAERITRVHPFPTDKRNIRDQLGSALAVSQLELATGQPQASRARLEAAYATATRLAAKDPEDMTLAQQRVVLALALVRTLWSLPPPANTAQIRALLAACDSPAAAEPEVQDFCMTTRAQDALRAGRTDPQATAYLVRHKARLAASRSSPRWGIDFRGEIANAGIH